MDRRKLIRRLRRCFAPLLIVALLVLTAVHWQQLEDYVRLMGYTPPDAIASLADTTGMTPKARKLFYVNHPEVDDRDVFNTSCTDQSEETIVLGCYHPVDKGIYIFAVQDIRLQGVEQVTAAHEMLHAAYDRLSSGERKTIDGELQDFYDHHVTDERIRSTMAAYQVAEPNDVVNEMHSIFGTEIAQLTPQLEDYYKQYFTDRSKVVKLAADYQQEFTSRQDRVKAYDAQLAALKSSIDANTAELKRQQAVVKNLKSELDSDRAAGNISAYNAGVSEYNARVDSFNALINATQASISQYNDIVKERNSIALEVRQLTHSIDSQFTPIAQ